MANNLVVELPAHEFQLPWRSRKVHAAVVNGTQQVKALGNLNAMLFRKIKPTLGAFIDLKVLVLVGRG